MISLRSLGQLPCPHRFQTLSYQDLMGVLKHRAPGRHTKGVQGAAVEGVKRDLREEVCAPGEVICVRRAWHKRWRACLEARSRPATPLLAAAQAGQSAGRCQQPTRSRHQACRLQPGSAGTGTPTPPALPTCCRIRMQLAGSARAAGHAMHHKPQARARRGNDAKEPPVVAAQHPQGHLNFQLLFHFAAPPEHQLVQTRAVDIHETISAEGQSPGISCTR